MVERCVQRIYFGMVGFAQHLLRLIENLLSNHHSKDPIGHEVRCHQRRGVADNSCLDAMFFQQRRSHVGIELGAELACGRPAG